MYAIIITSAHTDFFSVANISLFTFTRIRTMRVITDSVLVTVV